MRPLWIKAAALLIFVWLVAGVVIWSARRARPTPESVVRFANEHPIEGKSAAERDRVIRDLAKQLNQLEYEARQHLRTRRRLDEFFKSLNSDERLRFLDLTAPAGFHQMMDAFNKMPPAKRKAFVERALTEMKQRAEDETTLSPDDPNVQKMIEHGLHAFYSDASTETKMDLSPLIEQMHKNLQGIR